MARTQKTVRSESDVRLVVSEFRQHSGAPMQLNFTAIFKNGNFCQGSISADAEFPVQARFPQLEIALQFDSQLKPVLAGQATGMRKEMLEMARLLSEALSKNEACREFMAERGFRRQRLD